MSEEHVREYVALPAYQGIFCELLVGGIAAGKFCALDAKLSSFAIVQPA